MPEDPDVAKVLYKSVKQELKSLYLKNSGKQSGHAAWCEGDADVEGASNVLHSARLAVSSMAGQDEIQKWKQLAKVWLDILIYIVNTAEDAYPHTEQMAKGGELLTHFWVLLGHLGPKHASAMDSSCAEPRQLGGPS
ncbi:hypothetical protein GOP47_0007696 [Adiantum capillus-veneris]|uniref:Uncharacterized protein n=1 Tax=Adiantum capillus-veneris TaxID=13818 RepID=A0A9D4ZL65_ADICA|nr:hypothetical protein GOP47_0007696 [Adiantum capillus-veneris]